MADDNTDVQLNADTDNADTVSSGPAAEAAPAPDPNAAPDPTSVLSGQPTSAPPDLSGGGQPQMPAFAGTINGMTGQAQAPPAPQSKWDKVIMGALMGMSGGGGKNFAQGMSSGIKNAAEYQQQQKQNDVQQQQMAMEQQRSMDSHQLAQAQLATAHINQQTLAAQYNMMPKSTQDLIDRQSIMSGAAAKENPDNKVVGTYSSYAEAQSVQMAQQKANPDTALSTMLYHNASGGFDVINIANPNKLNDKPVTATIGYDFGKKTPITKTYAPGTITPAQQSNLESTALLNLSNANNQIEQHKAMSAIDTQADIEKDTAKQKLKASLANNTGVNEDGTWNESSIPVSLVNHTMDPSQLSKRSQDYNAKIEAANKYSMQKYGKPFDLAQAQTDYKFANRGATQDMLKMVGAMQAPNGELAIAVNAAKNLPAMNNTEANNAFNYTATKFGSSEATNFHTSMIGFADLYAKAMGGGVGTDALRQSAMDVLKDGYSRGQLNGSIDTLRQQITARKEQIIQSNPYLQRQFPMFANAPGKPRMMSQDGGKTWQTAPQQPQ